MSDPKLLRIPRSFHNVEDVLATASKLNLPNVIVLSELSNGNMVFLDSDISCSHANWILDRIKALLLIPNYHETVNDIGHN